MDTLTLEVKRAIPLVFAHLVPGRDPPSLCLVSGETSQTIVILAHSQSHTVKLEELNETKDKGCVEEALLKVLENVSPEPLKVTIRLKSHCCLSSLQTLALAMDAMLTGLQAYYSEKFDLNDYADILAGALMDTGIPHNIAMSSSICIVKGASNVYSRADGPIEVSAKGPYRFRVVFEGMYEHSSRYAEFDTLLLDITAKLSSLAIVEVLRSVEKGEGLRDALRLFNGIWYLLGVNLDLLHLAEKEEAIITASLPGRIAVIGLVKEIGGDDH